MKKDNLITIPFNDITSVDKEKIAYYNSNHPNNVFVMVFPKMELMNLV